MNVTGKTRIYAKDFDGRTSYSRSIAWHPMVDGNVDKGAWERAYEQVQFLDRAEIPDGTTIEIKDAFESGYRKRDGDVARKLIVKEYEIIEQGKPQGSRQYDDEPQGFAAFQDNDIPF